MTAAETPAGTANGLDLPIAELLTAAPPVPGIVAGSPLEGLERFRLARLRALRAGLIHGPLTAGPMFVCHLLPLDGMHRHISLVPLHDALRDVVSVPGSYTTGSRHNVDGVAVVADHQPQPGATDASTAAGAVQWFRFGGVEVAAAECVAAAGTTAYRRPVLWEPYLVQLLKDELPAAARFLRERFGMAGPLAVSASLVGMQGVILAVAANPLMFMGPGIDRPLVLTPWYATDDELDAVAACKRLAEVLWQSAGRPTPNAVLRV